MVTVVRSTIIEAPIETVWGVLRDFNSHDLWHPAVTASEIEGRHPADQPGCVRRFRLRDGAELREQLIALSDRARSLSYCILASPIPLLDYVATVTLRPVTDRDHTLWEWRSSFGTPAGREDELARLVGQDIYEGGFAGLRAFLSRGGPVAAARPRSVSGSSPRVALDGEAIVLRAHGGPETLTIEKITALPPAAGEVRVRQTAIGVNYVDVYVRTGEYPFLTPPGTPGVEAAGVVVDVGAGVSHLLPGDRVAYACLPVGAYASVRTMKADQVVVVPDTLDDETAAAAMLKGLTAECLVRQVHRVRRGEVVVVHAAAGGVGLLLCQWAKDLGATVIGTVGTPEKARLARDAGCEYPLIAAAGNLAERVAEITGGHGADVIYDGIGKDTFAASLDALAVRGHLVGYGHASGAPSAVGPGQLAAKSASLTSPVIFHYTAEPKKLRAMSQSLFGMIAAGRLRISVNQRFPLRAAADAHRALEARRTTGSTVLIP